MVACADTSFLCSLYAQDANSRFSLEWKCKNSLPLCLTHFQRHEFRNAARLGFFRKIITADQCSQTLASLEEDMHSGALVFTPTNWDEAYVRAEILSKSPTADTLLAFNARQHALAKIAKLKTSL